MKKTFIFLLTLATLQVWANNPPKTNGNTQTLTGRYKYQVAVKSQPEAAVVMCNGQIDNIQNGTKRGWGDLSTAITAAYKTSITQKTVNATSNLISLGVSYATALIQKPANDFESWSKAKREQCTYNIDLSSQETIDDFYYRPSANGALDPRDLKFDGFTCRNFIEAQGREKTAPAGKNTPRIGHDAFYLSCKLRTDSLGLAHLINHSKFMLDVDSLVFYPRYCNIPNNNPKNAGNGFNFDAYTDLELEIRVKVLSSWINEAIMITSDHKLGEFIIRARIEKEALQTIGKDTLFVYGKNNQENKKYINIIGESFIVPRSYVGTANEPLWGTGQYKLAIEVTQTCQLNAKYYLNKEEYIKIEEVGNGQAVNFANLPGYKKWNKEVWKEEWRTMKRRKKSDSFLTNAWKEIKTAYIGTNWVKELVDPAVTQILNYEAQELNELFDLNSSTPVQIPSSNKGSAQKPTANTAQPGMMPK